MMFVGGPQDCSVIPSPLVTDWVFELVGTWLGQGLCDFGTRGLGIGLDNGRTKSTSFQRRIQLW